jgi:hypothetical protein
VAKATAIPANFIARHRSARGFAHFPVVANHQPTLVVQLAHFRGHATHRLLDVGGVLLFDPLFLGDVHFLEAIVLPFIPRTPAKAKEQVKQGIFLNMTLTDCEVVLQLLTTMA